MCVILYMRNTDDAGRLCAFSGRVFLACIACICAHETLATIAKAIIKMFYTCYGAYLVWFNFFAAASSVAASAPTLCDSPFTFSGAFGRLKNFCVTNFYMCWKKKKTKKLQQTSFVLLASCLPNWRASSMVSGSFLCNVSGRKAAPMAPSKNKVPNI